MSDSIQHNDFSKYLPERQQTHLLLLTQNTTQPAQEHWEIAAELIELGMARGRVIPETASGKRGILCVVNFAPTAHGRNYVEQLQLQAMMNSPQYKHWQFIKKCKNKIYRWLTVTASNVIATILIEWSTGAISRLLGVVC